MKIVASILVLYFGLLMMQPFANMEHGDSTCQSCLADKCCKERSQPKKTAPVPTRLTCNTDFCNPFVPCGISIAVSHHTG